MKMMGKAGTIILALILLLNLAACGGKVAEVGNTTASYTEPSHTEPSHTKLFDASGYYILEKVIEDGEDITGEEFRELELDYYILLDEDGTAEYQGDELITGTWENGVLTFNDVDGDTATIDYKIEGDELIIGSGDFIMIYIRSDGPSTQTDGAETNGDSELSGGIQPDATSAETLDINALSEAQRYWDGDWYGYWRIGYTSKKYEVLDDEEPHDCFAVFKMNPDNTGTMHLWEAGGDIATAEIKLYEGYGPGGFDLNIQVSGNHLSGSQLDNAQWMIYDDMYGFENYVTIDGSFEDTAGESFNYAIYLYPWGEKWEDEIVEDGKKPVEYESWYLNWYNKATMREAILDRGGHIHYEIADSWK